MNYTLQPATESDKEYLESLHKCCYHGVVVEQFGDWNDAVQKGFFEKTWNSCNFQIIFYGDERAGAFSTETRSDHVMLTEIQIEPRFQGHGLGTQVVQKILADAGAKKLSVRLRVLQKNRANSLYLRLGFRITGETETHVFMEKSTC